MYDEDDLLPISALQHLAFCERQWALIHLEGAWAENRLTVEGHHLHDRAHRPETESRGDLRIARGLRLRSLRLGLSGIADVVEFHRLADAPDRSGSRQDQTPTAVRLPGIPGLWQPIPVEYKRGRPKLGPYDEIQLCAQALCFEEMLTVSVPAGTLFYGEPRQRHEVLLSLELREQTENLAARLHDLTRIGKTPLARYERKCDSCSLFELCLPKELAKAHAVGEYILEAISLDEGKEQ